MSAIEPSKGTIAFVPPRYGPDVVGGAEAVVAELAHGFAERGWQVEVLTTRARDHFTWDNHYPAGVEQDGQVLVRRFSTVVSHREERDRIAPGIIRGDDVPIEKQQQWMNAGLRVPELWHFVLQHSANYRAIVVAPYLFWTSFAVGQIDPQRTIVMPCLHDEPEAHLPIFKPLINDARGLLFLSDPERDLAQKIFGPHPRSEVVGAGVEAPDAPDVEAFRKMIGFDTPFVFYAGRREYGKGFTDIVRAMTIAVEQGVDLRLVTSGVGEVIVPDSIKDRVVDLGFVSTDVRDAAMAAASAYVQPSKLESFSRTVMEAWLAGTLVIANRGSEVVAWHVERSKAGLLYDEVAELVEALRFVADEPQLAAELAAPGARYVQENYDADTVLNRVESRIDEWTRSE